MRAGLFLILILAVLSKFSIAKTTVTGKALSHTGSKVELYKYADLITYTEKLLSESIVDDNGTFKVTCNEINTFYGFLKIEGIKGFLYIEPNSAYEIDYPDKQYKDIPIPKDKLTVKPKFISESPGDLNTAISDFNQHYDRFLQDNYVDFMKKRARTKVDTFIYNMQKQYAHRDSSFFTDYLMYSYANLEQSSLHGMKNIYNLYLNGQPVRYENTSYMEYLGTFFGSNYLVKLLSSSNETSRRLNETMIQQRDYKETLKILATEPYMDDPQLREIFLLKSLYDTYNDKVIPTKCALTMLKDLQQTSKYSEHRIIAGNMIDKLTRLSAGMPAPEFALYDADSILVQLSDLRGKFVYLDFWATWCKPCISEMKLMPELKKKYGRYIKFVSVSIDRDYNKMKEFLQINDSYDWTFLHYGHQTSIKEDYEVRGIPMYYLIDPDGNLLLSPANRPTENIGETFSKICRKLEPKD